MSLVCRAAQSAARQRASFRASIGFAMLIAASGTASPLQLIPIVQIERPDAVGPDVFGEIAGVRSLPSGDVLVNDRVHRQLVLLDSGLRRIRIILDSVVGRAQSYGPMATRIVAALGDSTWFLDVASLSIVVIDPAGRVQRTMAAPRTRDLPLAATFHSGVDSRGRWIYRSFTASGLAQNTAARTIADSVPLVRVDESGAVDTVGRIRFMQSRDSIVTTRDGRRILQTTIVPLSRVDDFTVTADGSLAMVRGGDYHIDWLRSDGTTVSTPPMPYDWRRISPAEKQQIVDSIRREFRRIAAGRGPRGRQNGPMPFETDVAGPEEIGDYYPPFNLGVVEADADGNIWVPPNTSLEARDHQIIYDVINTHGRIIRRVRLPKDRLAVGFARGGVVYMAAPRSTGGFRLERGRIPR